MNLEKIKQRIEKIKQALIRYNKIKIEKIFLFYQKLRNFKKRLVQTLHFKMLEKIFLVGIILFATIWSGILGYSIYKFQTMDDIKELDDYSLYEIPSILYDVKGRKITEFYLYKRQIIPYHKIPKEMVQTLITAEDNNFFEHDGIDFSGIIRAFFKNIRSGKITQGGSTISQQLAKLLFTTRKRTIFRKLKELWLTLQIEKKYTKEEILEKYLNKVYYGNNLYGLQAASKFYFGKNAQDLNYVEAAFLVCIPPAPSFLNPLKNPMRVKERQQFILNKMVKEKYISHEEMEKEFKLFWLNFQERLITGDFYKSRLENLDRAPYFSEYIRKLITNKFPNTIYVGGYRIYSTLDIDKQEKAEQALRNKINEHSKTYAINTDPFYKKIQDEYPRLLEFLGYSSNLHTMEFYKSELDKDAYNHIAQKEAQSLDLLFSSFGLAGESMIFEKVYNQKDSVRIDYPTEGALVSIEVPSGRIVAMVGGSGWTPFNQLNRAYQARRQPGSSFKPFIYLSALLSKRFSAASVVNDIPVVYKYRTEIEGNKKKEEIWIPGNTERKYAGRITLRKALRASVNIVSVRLIEAMGADNIAGNASKILGLPDNRFRKDFSLALGTSEMTPLEMAKGFGVFANMGKDIFPHPIIKVENRYGKIIWNMEGETLSREQEQIVAPEAVYVLNSMMKGVLGGGGTAAGAALRANFHYPGAAGKTGTSSNYRDAWFVGFTPNLVTSVWIGFDKGISLSTWNVSQNQIEIFGAELAAPVWLDYMTFALKDYPLNDFVSPGGLNYMTVCARSGMLPSPECTETIEELFIPGSEPKDVCNIESEYKISDEELEKIKLGN